MHLSSLFYFTSAGLLSLSLLTQARQRPQTPGPDTSANGSIPLNHIPSYVFDFAPLVHLYSGEKFWPCDIAEHLEHVTPFLNYTPITATSNNLNLRNLDKLNEYERGRFVYLTSDDDVEARPDWLGGEKNIPYIPEENNRQPSRDGKNDQKPMLGAGKTQIHGGRSDAPAVLVTVDKGHGIVDAFWFFFYSYNLGNLVFNVRFGNHVGDWEHSVVRFQHGKPKQVFVSEHYFGQAYTYDAVEKIGNRVSQPERSPFCRPGRKKTTYRYSYADKFPAQARHLLRRWHSRHVRHPRSTPLYPSPRPPAR